MKVLLLTSFPADPAAPRGGVEAVSVNLVAALARRPGLQVEVLTADRNATAESTTTWSGAKVHRIPMGAQRLLRYVLGRGKNEVRAWIERLKPDVIHAHDFYGMMVTGLNVPRVFTVHGFIHEDTRYSGQSFARLRAWLWKRHEVAGWAEQPHIISISPYVRERLAGIAAGLIHDIENPIDAAAFSTARNEVHETVFCAAAVTRRKNTLGLVQAFASLSARHPDAQLRIAGPFTEVAYKQSVEEVIHQHDLTDRVHLLGPVSAERVREELSRASVFALPSFEEGAPMGISEALAVGVPVVTSNRCGMPYMVQHGETGFLVEPDDVNELAMALDELLSNPALRQRMGGAAVRFARAHYHPDGVAERTEAVYRQAIGTVTKA